MKDSISYPSDNTGSIIGISEVSKNEALLPIVGISMTYPNENTLSLYSCSWIPASLFNLMNKSKSLPQALLLVEPK